MAEAGPGGAGATGEQNCIFCHIISGKVQSKKVYEDPECIGILDINPANPGHVLILPKKHYAIMPQMDELIIGHLFMVSKGISGALLKALKVEGTNIFVANGAVAGQKAPHFMAHVIPRKDGDGLNFTLPEYKVSLAELIKVRDMLLPRIKANLSVSDTDIEKMKALAPGSDSHAAEGAEKKRAQTQQEAPQQHQPEAPQYQPRQMQKQSEDHDVDLDAISGILKPITTHGTPKNTHPSANQSTAHQSQGEYREEHESRNVQMLAKEEAEQMKERQTEMSAHKKKISLTEIDSLFKSRGK